MNPSLPMVLLTMCAANFFYQGVVAEPHWMSAFERSYFQAFAILSCWFWWKRPKQRTSDA